MSGLTISKGDKFTMVVTPSFSRGCQRILARGYSKIAEAIGVTVDCRVTRSIPATNARLNAAKRTLQEHIPESWIMSIAGHLLEKDLSVEDIRDEIKRFGETGY